MEKLYDLCITSSYSRPQVSKDQIRGGIGKAGRH